MVTATQVSRLDAKLGALGESFSQPHSTKKDLQQHERHRAAFSRRMDVPCEGRHRSTQEDKVAVLSGARHSPPSWHSSR
jgi:hypothetical protein